MSLAYPMYGVALLLVLATAIAGHMGLGASAGSSWGRCRSSPPS